MPEDETPLTILHDDGALVAVAKLPGVPVIAARGEPPEACLQKRLERQLGRRVYVVHRIDRDASGVVVFATSAAAHREASLAFEHRRVDKRYLAIVAGALEPAEGTFETPLHAARKGKDAARAGWRSRGPGRGHRLLHAAAPGARRPGGEPGRGATADRPPPPDPRSPARGGRADPVRPALRAWAHAAGPRGGALQPARPARRARRAPRRRTAASGSRSRRRSPTTSRRSSRGSKRQGPAE